MVKVVIHVGQHKSGSSSIQNTLHKAQREGTLSEFRYLSTPLPNHSFLVGNAFASEKNVPYYKNIKSGSKIPRRHPKFRNSRDLIREEMQVCRDRECPLVLSSEDLSALHPSEVRDMRSYFEECGATEFLVIGYIRPAQSWSSSFAQQLIKQGETSIPAVLKCPPVPQYRESFEKFQSTFGSENLVVRRYGRRYLYNECVVQDFLKTSGWARSANSINIINRNLGVNLDQVRMISGCFEYLQGLGGKFDKVRAKHIRHIIPHVESRKFALSREALERVTRGIQQDLPWVEKNLGIDRAFLLEEAPALDEADLLHTLEKHEMQLIIEKALEVIN